MVSTLTKEIGKAHSRCFRRCFIKRRGAVTGAFESDWFEISDDVKKWGKIGSSVDVKSANKIKFNSVNLKFANDDGKYNSEDSPSSYWFGYANQQRTLLKIEYGFIDQSFTDGVWSSSEFPQSSRWGLSKWGKFSWGATSKTFAGLISGDQPTSDKNEAALKIKPLTQVFVDYPAERIDGWTATGITASKFIEMLRDQTDGSSNFVFRPFFGNSVGGFDIATTTNIYPNLNTSSAKDVIDKTCWQVIEKLSQAENYIPQIKSGEIFKFGPKDITTTTSFDFYGAGTPNNEHPITIKKINKYGPKLSNYYSRVQLRYIDTDTETSYQTAESQIEVAGGNAPWNYGYRTFGFENTWITDTITAATITDNLFSELGALKKELDFNASFIPQLEILDFVSVTYDSSPIDGISLWDQNSWDTELTWDASTGDNIQISNEEFKIISVTIDLDKLETKFILRET